jgi:hypothetical protein
VFADTRAATGDSRRNGCLGDGLPHSETLAASSEYVTVLLELSTNSTTLAQALPTLLASEFHQVRSRARQCFSATGVAHWRLDIPALKGRDNTAQGNALGLERPKCLSPEKGDILIGRDLLVAPLQGFGCWVAHFPSALPWARLFGPFRPRGTLYSPVFTFRCPNP